VQVAIGVVVGLSVAGIIRLADENDDHAIEPKAAVLVTDTEVRTTDGRRTTSTLSSSLPASSDETSTIPEINPVVQVIPEPSEMVISAADALGLLKEITVELEHRGGYNRDLFAVWSDLDGNTCDAREDVLAEEALTTTAKHGCATEGTWRSAYDGKFLSSDAEVEVDHVVALKEAWESGGWAWPVELRIGYANDTADSRTLIAVSAVSNNSKSDSDPANWLPSDPGAVCSYLIDWVAIKHRWHLAMDQAEWQLVRKQLSNSCI